MGQVGWILDHPRDLDADFRSFYHLSWKEAVSTLDGPELLGLAYRTPVFPGVMQLRAQQGEEKKRHNVRHAPDTELISDTDSIWAEVADIG